MFFNRYLRSIKMVRDWIMHHFILALILALVAIIGGPLWV
jgi:hypothetical protein